MQQEQSFEVIVRRKVPYVTSFLFHLLVVFGIMLLIIDFFFLPARHASDEMKVAYFILVVPDFVKNALYISTIGFFTVLPLYIGARFYRKAILTFLPENILIQGNKINVDISISSLRRVYCMDSYYVTGQSRDKLTIYFQQAGDKTIRVRLKHYVQSEEFMARLIQYENVDFKSYDFNVSPDPENEE